MNLRNLFKRRPKKSLLKIGDFSYTEESFNDKNGESVVYKDYNATGWIWNTPIHVCFSEYDIENLDLFIVELNDRLDSINESREMIEKEIIQELFTLRNETWIEHDDDQVSKQEFIKRIKPDHLTISNDLSYDLRFDDGDLFWGHTIVFHGDSSNKCDGVGLEG
ncbi:MAG: DUF2262 domain-containing protein [Flavobacteriales bacterium]|nr:DUF2262 domain-containing protein [Flavobacteriales bacterium]